MNDRDEWLADEDDPNADWEDDPYDEDDDDDDSLCIRCPNCGADVYEDSVLCPHCGEFLVAQTHPFADRPVWWVLLGMLGIGAVIVVLAGLA
jgi:hypothetical protein